MHEVIGSTPIVSTSGGLRLPQGEARRSAEFPDRVSDYAPMPKKDSVADEQGPFSFSAGSIFRFGFIYHNANFQMKKERYHEPKTEFSMFPAGLPAFDPAGFIYLNF